MFGRVPAFDIRKFVFLVHVDQDVIVDRFAQAGPLDLPRLKNCVAVRENDYFAVMTKLLDHIERTGKQTVRKRIIDQKIRKRQYMRIIWKLTTIFLQRPEIISVTQRASQLFKDLPIS